MNDEEFDSFLRKAMQSRPEAPAPAKLAARAMARGTKPAFDLSRLFSAVAAFLLIGGLFAVAAWRWYLYALSGDSTDATSTTNAANVVSTRNATMLLVGGAVLVVALGLVTLEKLFSRDDVMTPVYF